MRTLALSVVALTVLTASQVVFSDLSMRGY